jgi:hypothetical protein
MKNSQNYENALKEGKCVVRKVWASTTSDKMNVQFQQEYDKAIAEGGNILAAISMGLDPSEMNKTRPTALWALVPSMLEAKGILEGEYFTSDRVVTVEDVFGVSACIQIVENTTKNDRRKEHQPKVNPQTNEVLLYNGEPIYVHTQLIPGTKPNHKYQPHNGTMSLMDWKSKVSTEVKEGEEVAVEADF